MDQLRGFRRPDVNSKIDEAFVQLGVSVVLQIGESVSLGGGTGGEFNSERRNALRACRPLARGLSETLGELRVGSPMSVLISGVRGLCEVPVLLAINSGSVELVESDFLCDPVDN